MTLVILTNKKEALLKMDKQKSNVPLMQKLSILLGGAGITGTYSLVTMLAMIFYTDVMGLSPGAVGIMILIAKIWDAINDPMCGVLIDRTNSRFGKVKPWLFGGGIGIFVFGVLLFTVPGFSQTGKLVWAYLTYNLVGMAFTACVIGTVTYIPRITKTPLEQVSLSAFYSLGQSIAALVLSAVVMKLLAYFGAMNPLGAYRDTALVIGGVGLVLTLFFVFITKEHSVEGEQQQTRTPLKETFKALLHNKPFLLIAAICVVNGLASGMHTASMVHYVTYVLGNAGLASNLMFVIYGGIFLASISGKFLARFDKLLICKITFLVAAAGLLVRLISGDGNLTVMLVAEAAIGLGGGLFTVYSIPLLIDCAEYGYRTTGTRSDGMIMSSLTFQTKIGQGLGTAVMGIWLELAGYMETQAVQPESAVHAMRDIHLIPYLIIALVSFALLHFYPLSSRKMAELTKEDAPCTI